MHKLSVLMNKSNGSLLTLLLLICLITISQSTLAGEKEKKDIDRIESFDDLFGTPQPSKEKPETKTEIIQKAASQTTQDTVKFSPASQSSFTGFYQNDMAYTYGDKAHLSRFNNTVDFSTQGRTDIGIEWKIGGRVMYDATYDLTNFYPGPVRKDQRFEVKLREAYFDFSAAGLDFRLGRQHIVWGEMVGLFFADVVSAKDLRQLVLPDFDMIRIPQWAIRAEYFKGDWHAEAVWIPYMSYDNIGKPGAEFYPSIRQR